MSALTEPRLTNIRAVTTYAGPPEVADAHRKRLAGLADKVNGLRADHAVAVAAGSVREADHIAEALAEAERIHDDAHAVLARHGIV